MRGTVMSTTRWVEITCTIPELLTEDLSNFLLELTGNGVSIENRIVDTFDIDDLADEPVKNVKCYLPDNEGLPGLLAEIRTFLAAPEYNGIEPMIILLKEEDWANSWKSNFKPTRIGQRLVIKPSWEDFTGKAEDIILELDPGMAFGTGTHATTRLCLEALEALMFEKPPQAEEHTVLDVGCGSGLLGIAAALLGAKKVVSIDIDPVAVQVTNENAAINRVTPLIHASETPLEHLDGCFSVVLANILAEALVSMRSALTARVAPEGALILSGILVEREEFVRAGFADQPLTLSAVTREDEWCCLIFRTTT